MLPGNHLGNKRAWGTKPLGHKFYKTTRTRFIDKDGSRTTQLTETQSLNNGGQAKAKKPNTNNNKLAKIKNLNAKTQMQDTQMYIVDI